MSKLYEEIYKLKNILRKGWVIRGACDKQTNRVESDAEHTFSMAILALEILHKENLKLDELKVIKMCLYHEICEVDNGDVTPYDNITKQQKYAQEYNCIKRIADECDMPEILEIWCEFENGETKEAKFVKIIDKLDAVMQSKIYSDKGLLFDEFYKNAEQIIKDYKKYIDKK